MGEFMMVEGRGLEDEEKEMEEEGHVSTEKGSKVEEEVYVN